jgi:hypothetical protein
MVSQKDNPRNNKDFLDRIPIRTLATLAIVVLAVVGVAVLYLGTKGQSAQDEAGTAQTQLDDANDQVATGKQLAGKNLEMCQNPEVVAVLQQQGLDEEVCELAIIVQTQGKAVPGETGERGPGPTMQQIREAVDDYFRTHPLPEGKAPTIEQLTTVVAGYLRANPPEPGRPPTAEEIATATASYIAANIEDFKVQGEQGEKGDPPTAEEVRAAVAAYCAEDSRCRGDQGPQGIGVTGTLLYRDEQGVCTLYFTHENPANGQTYQSQVQVNDELCEPLQGPTTEPTPSSPPIPTEGG